MLKASTFLKGNLCIYKCFMNALYIFDSFFKKNWEMRQTLLVFIFVMCSADFTCGNGSTIQSVLREFRLTVNLWVFE